VVPEVVHITDDEEEELMEVEASSATASDGPDSTPMAVPIPPVDAPVLAPRPLLHQHQCLLQLLQRN
jgi:hypothetical protein